MSARPAVQLMAGKPNRSTSHIAAITCPICSPDRFRSFSLQSRRRSPLIREGKLRALGVTTAKRTSKRYRTCRPSASS